MDKLETLDVDKWFEELDSYQENRKVLYSKWYGFIFKFYDKLLDFIWFCKAFDVDKEIKWFWQRGIRGYSDRDCWSLCSHISHVTLNGLKHIRDYNHSYPIGLTEDEWTIILNKMVFAFEKIKLLADGDAYFHIQGNLPTRDMTIFRKEDKKEIEEGWRLFKKYYYSLWD